MLTPEAIKAVNEFVYKQPRSTKEISQILKCSWITADKYVSYIVEKYGTIKVKIFRGGTKGALKIVYWANLEGMRASTAQQILLDRIKVGRRKQDFSPFEIYNLVEANKRKFSINENEDLSKVFKDASNQLFIFSGNISFINEQGLLEVLGDLARKRVNIKILCRVDIAALKNIKKILEINHLLGYDAIEIKHIEQPLRGFVIDNKLARLKEEKKKEDYKGLELDKDIKILYEIYDKDWVEWLEKVFWNLHSNALPIENRIKALEEVEDSLLNLK